MKETRQTQKGKRRKMREISTTESNLAAVVKRQRRESYYRATDTRPGKYSLAGRPADRTVGQHSRLGLKVKQVLVVNNASLIR